MFAIARARKLDLHEQVGLRWPVAKARLWLLGWVVWLFAEDAVAKALGVGLPSDWSGKTTGFLLLTAVAM